MDIFERLPDHLHLSRNANAPDYDRWRLYSSVTKEYLSSTSARTAEECMVKYIEIEDAEKAAWKQS